MINFITIIDITVCSKGDDLMWHPLEVQEKNMYSICMYL